MGLIVLYAISAVLSIVAVLFACWSFMDRDTKALKIAWILALLALICFGVVLYLANLWYNVTLF